MDPGPPAARANSGRADPSLTTDESMFPTVGEIPIPRSRQPDNPTRMQATPIA